MKLGKRKARIDKRTLPFRCMLKKLPIIPDKFDLEADRIYPAPMFANDNWGDCVIAGRAHQTLRFEIAEQNKMINISDDDVLNQYWNEGKKFCFDKKPDRGLVMLNSLKHWRKDGWTADDNSYNIYAFGKINQFDNYDIKASLYLLNGLNVGLSLPRSAQDQDIWTVVLGEDSTPGSWGGHCVYIRPSWDGKCLSCVTWGQKKLMTLEFFKMYCDEAYAVVDNKNRFICDSVIDVELLNNYLESIT